jgi:hypothetical protein
MAPSSGRPSSEIVVNLHVTERCNYHCSFCFGRWGIGSAERDLFEDADRAAALIADVYAVVAALRPDRQPVRFNFVGGEPAAAAGPCRGSWTSAGHSARGVSFVSKRADAAPLRPGLDRRPGRQSSGSAWIGAGGTNRRIGRATGRAGPVDVASLAAAVGEIRRLGPARG